MTKTTISNFLFKIFIYYTSLLKESPVRKDKRGSWIKFSWGKIAVNLINKYIILDKAKEYQGISKIDTKNGSNSAQQG